MNHQVQKGRKAVTEVLRFIGDEIVEAEELFEQWARHRRYRYEGEHKLAEERFLEEQALRKRLKYLKQKKFVTTKKVEKRLLIGLTETGKIELLSRQIRDRPPLPDGFEYLVVYDVPLEARSGRDALRYFLKKFGFQKVQQSVFQSNKNVLADVQTFIKRTKIESWVNVYLARKQD